jgi:hypothetical protein
MTVIRHSGCQGYRALEWLKHKYRDSMLKVNSISSLFLNKLLNTFRYSLSRVG